MKQLIRTMKKNRLMSTVLALTLTLALVLSTVMGLPVMANETDVWTGGTSKPAGNGVAGDPYLVSNGDELAWVMQEGGSGVYAELTADIYLNSLSTVNWATGAVNDYDALKRWTAGAFDGTIDGKGHVINGLFSRDFNETPGFWSSTNHVAAFIRNITATASVTLKNLAFDNFYVGATGRAAVMIGVSAKGAQINIDRCYVGANGFVEGYTAAIFVAYQQATNAATDFNITNSYNLLINVQAEKSAGFTGGSWGILNIKNCYSLSQMYGNDGDFVANCYSAVESDAAYANVTYVPAANMVGEAAAENMDLGDAFAFTASYPALKVFPHEAIKITPYWTGNIVRPAGEGIEGNPYKIYTADELAWVMQKGDSNMFAVLEADIYLNKATTVDWTTGTVNNASALKKWTAKTFNGTIDGKGHVVYGLYSTNYYKNDVNEVWGSTTYATGFIKNITATGAVTLKNLAFDNFYVAGTGHVAVMVAYSDKGAKFTAESCYVGANGAVVGTNVAPFCAYQQATQNATDFNITNCYSLLTNLTAKTMSGFTGGSWGTLNVTNCYSLGYMSGNGANFVNCYSASEEDVAQIEEYSYDITYVPTANMVGEAAADVMLLGDAYAYTASYPALKVFPHEAIAGTQYWTGNTVEPKLVDGVYLVATADELAWVMQKGDSNMNVKLTADIYLNKPATVDWATGTVNNASALKKWTPAAFSGTIDGDGHVIYGLYSKNFNATPGHWGGTSHNASFIKNVAASESVTIKNLAFDNFALSATSNACVMVAYADKGAKISIENCYVGANGWVQGQFATPFVCYVQGTENSTDFNITNCYSLLTNIEANKTAGFVGGSWGTLNISNCYSLGKMQGNTGKYIDCYSADATDTESGITYVAADDMKGAYALDNMPNLKNAFVATDAYPKPHIFVVQNVKSEGAQTYGKNLRFLMSYQGLPTDGNIVIINNKAYTVIERGIIIKGEGVSSQLMVDSNEKGVVKIRKTDLSDNWSFDAATGTTTYSLNILGFKKNDTYKVSARGYITLSDGRTHYSSILTTSVDEVPNQNIIDNKPYVPNTVTLTLYGDDSYGVTWQTEKQPEKAVVQVSKGSSFDEENYTEFEASTSAEQSYDINNALYTYYVSKAVIIGLKPNTTYTYRCYDTLVGVEGEEFTFTTRDRSVSSFKFVHVSDSQSKASPATNPNGVGTGYYYGNTMKGVELNGFDADFILHSGDIVEWSKYENYWTSMIGDNAKYFAEIPVMAIAGNHEASYRNGNRELYKHFNYKIHEQDVTNGFSYSFDYGNAKFVMLDTNNLTSEQVLSDDVYTWLEEILENNQQKWTIVTMHHPMYSVGKYGSDTSLNATSLALRAQLSDLFAENGVDLVIQGHDHTLSKTYPIGMNGAINNNLTYETINGTDYCTNANGVVYVMHGASGNQTRWPVDTVETQYYEEYSNSETSTWAEFEITESLLTVKVYSYNSGTPKLLMSYGIKK